ncbi:hypothetical protein [Aliikangiella sp. IMCC44359]|uniref:hypothetical protein n=1 Tax=Aliikangiella sp. IMCC44359 TaxID=3459125 RepID=UPI00403A8590
MKIIIDLNKKHKVFGFIALVCLGLVSCKNTKIPTNENLSDENTTTSFGQLFTGSPCGKYGTLGCMNKGKQCNDNWQSYFKSTANSITMTAGNDCRTVSTHDSCQFTVGDGAITAINFDFDISDSCHGPDGIEWLSFWMYRDPWSNTVEVDFIESKYGPGSGLNTNFAGVGNQVVIFDSSQTTRWKGSIMASFSGSGNAVEVTVSNSNNSNIATTTLTESDGYYFVMDTATGSTATDCQITVSNLVVTSDINYTSQMNQCVGLNVD